MWPEIKMMLFSGWASEHTHEAHLECANVNVIVSLMTFRTEKMPTQAGRKENGKTIFHGKSAGVGVMSIIIVLDSVWSFTRTFPSLPLACCIVAVFNHGDGSTYRMPCRHSRTWIHVVGLD